ncbi:MAG: hypothetical protein R3B40_15375 [Polyangiales bacterium]|nr:hypothetical protein [Myxococcales bacterium]MCB9658342.1 hypothetical protein [Sandaracinaceae bacterium]
MPKPSSSISRASRATRVSQFLAALALVAAAPAALSAGGCGGGGGRTTTPEAEDGVRGAVTVENRSQLQVCSLMLMYDGGYATQEVELAPGASAQLDVQGDTNRLYVTECGGERSLLGHPMNWYGTPQGPAEMLQNLQHDRIVLYDPGQAPADATDHRAVALNPRPISDWIFWQPPADSGLAQEFHQALLQKAQRESWSENLVFSVIISGWSETRNRYTGILTGRSAQAAGFARWPDGHCTMQAFGYTQGHDGYDYAGALQVGVSTQLHIPCAALEYAAGLAGASPNSEAAPGSSGGGSAGGATTGGGMCTNTCRTANDGECDDGGPNSLYSVCQLGTDCADCGAR